MNKVISWRIFFILLFASLLSIFAIFPYILSVQGDLISQTGVPLLVIFIAQLVQSIILFSVTIFFGLLLTKKIGFHLPLLESLVAGKGYRKTFTDIFGLSVACGVFAASAIYLIDFIFTAFGSSVSTSVTYAPIWQTLLASFYGGITEEILMRLFLMSLFVWVLTKFARRTHPSRTGIIISIILAAVIFGLGHLPITASLTAITPLVVLRAIVLNGIGGVIFGLLFWQKGLESAIIAHFTADVFLLTLLPLIFQLL